MHLRLELNCPGCGTNGFAYPKSDAELVHCVACGASVGTLGELKQRVAAEVTKQARARRKRP